MTVRHSFDRDDIDLVALRAALSARFGLQVELLTSGPTEADPNGVLILEHPDTGEYLDMDPATVAAVVDAQPVALSEDERAIAEFDAAPTVALKLAAWRASLGRRVARDRERRDRVRDMVRQAQAEQAARPVLEHRRPGAV